jgi:signal transduction histidine kinase/FixJ family two-component response regulator
MNPYPIYKVLVVDDDRQLVETISDYLDEENLTVYKEYGGEGALKSISEHQPDIVISDIRMQDIDGWELFRRTAAMRTQMVFIFMTGYGSIPDAADSIRKGIFDYLEKPFSANKLKRVVNSAIEFLDTLAENRYLQGQLDHLRSQYSEVDRLLKRTSMLTDFMSSLKEEDSIEEILKKLLRVSIEITASSKGSIFQYRSKEASLDLVMIDWLENDNGLAGHAFIPVSKSIASGGKIFSSKSLEDFPDKVPQECLPVQCSLTIPVEDAHKAWGILYLHERISGGPYSSEDFINVSSLTRKAVERLNQIEYMGQDSIFSTDREKLKKEHQRLRIHKNSIEKSSPIISVLIDQDFNILHTCERYREIFGNGNRLLSNSFKKERIWSILGKSIQEKIFNALSKNEVFVVDESIPFDMPNGSRLFKIKVIPISANMTYQCANSYMILMEDMTEQERITKRLLLLENLAIMGKFVASIAHDLNNPLDGINRLIQVLEIKVGSTARVEHEVFEMIYSAIRRMGNTVRSFLECTRDAMLKTTSSPLRDLIEEAIYIMMPTLKDKNISLIKEYSSKNVNIDVPTSFYHVFINIIKNAFDAMSNGGLLKVQIIDKKDRKSVLAIFSDNGHGIPDIIMDDVTKPFFTTKEDGTGLGLSLCKKIARSFGGEVTLKNRESGGCEVCVTIPIP